MNKHIYPPCNSHAIHSRKSNFAPKKDTSRFAETDSSIGEVVSLVHLPLYRNPLGDIVLEEKAVTRVVRECLEARGESTHEEEMIDVVGGGEVGARSGAESEGVTFVDALRRVKLIAASHPETVLDTFGMPIRKNHLYDNL